MAALGRSSALRNALRYFSQGSASSAAPPKAPAVAGLSTAVVRTPGPKEGPSVPGDKSGEYKVPEYFCFDTMSYYEAEVEMEKFRLPQPSATK